jgi:FKBP-type peptidyl-prolyl cis-trans isomerase FklB
MTHSSLYVGLLAAVLSIPAWADAPAASNSSAAPAAQAQGSATAASEAPLVGEKDLTSYSVGVTTGRALRSADGAEVNYDALVRGIKDGLEAAKLKITERQMQSLLGKFQQTLRQKMSASRSRAIVENRQKADKFFAENKTREGIVTLTSGVQYRILKSGTGPLAREADVVAINYRGTLLDGKEFDATEPDHPASLKVAALIAGWKEALKLMPVGSHWQVFIPPALGYGERGIGADIGPNEALVFDIELLGASLSKD